MATKIDDIENKIVLPKPKIKLQRRHLIIILVIVFIAALGFFLKNYFLVARVNNSFITRPTLDKELEKQGGKQVLESKITELVIYAEADKQKIVISQAEIDEKINKLEEQLKAQNQELDSLLTQQGQTRKDLEKQIKIQIIVEKILGKDIQISDKEVSDYFETNKQYYPKDTKLETKKDEIKATLVQQKLSEKAQPWLEEIKKSASIQYFTQF